MPKVLEKNGFTFYFFAADCQERPHVHVKKGSGRGKIWISPQIEIFYLRGFKQQEQRKIVSLVNEHIVHLNQQWHAYCSNG